MPAHARVRPRVSAAVRRRRLILVVGASLVFLLALGGTVAFGLLRAGEPGQQPVAGEADSPQVTGAAAPSPTAVDAAVVPPAAEPTPAAPAIPAPVAAVGSFDIDSAASTTVIVNKARPLAGGSSYVPADLVAARGGELMRADAAEALGRLYDAAEAAGHGLSSASGYRSYDTQVSTYGGYVSSLGQDGADLTSARPGHSEHQTGLVMDIVDSEGRCGIEDNCMSQIPAGQWLAENAWQSGFVLRYPSGMTHITGFEFEPWHYRYIGVDAAAAYHASPAATLEEFFALPAAPDYV